MSSPFDNIGIEQTIHNLPDIVWVKDIHLRYIACSEQLIQAYNFPSKQDLIGHDDYDLPWNEHAEHYRDSDQQIFKNGKSYRFSNYSVKFLNGKEQVVLTQKSPFYDQHNQLIGTIGRNIIPQDQLDAQQYIMGTKPVDPLLTKRESLCLFHFARGKTTREIAQQMFISQRTAEKYMISIKEKFSCKTKSEVIDKAVDMGILLLRFV